MAAARARVPGSGAVPRGFVPFAIFMPPQISRSTSVQRMRS
jgi:hypothetical protein